VIYLQYIKKVCIVPEPKSLEFSGGIYFFGGFRNFPEFLALEFNVSREEWEITRVAAEARG